MYLRIMHFFEDTDDKERTCLKLWRTESDKLYIEMAPESESDAIYGQIMALGSEDAEVLAEEILRIVREIKRDQPPPEPKKKKSTTPLFRFETTNGDVKKMPPQ